jgi:hypothetical protein
MTVTDPPRPVRMIDAHDAASADAAREALDRDLQRFDRDGVTAAQRSLIVSEAETILRRLAAAEREAAREREETEALAEERRRYAQAAEALAQTPSATAEDARGMDEAIAMADRVLAAQRAADVRTAEWLGAVRGSVEGLLDVLADETGSAAAAASPPVLRSLSRAGAMLGTMLREAETQRDRTEEALNVARARPFAAVERNPAVAAAVARAERDEDGNSGPR